MSIFTRPGFLALTLQHGTTPRLRGRLTSRNVRTSALTVRPVAGDVIAWTIRWPGAAVSKTTAADGGLELDPVSRVFTFPLTTAEVNAIPAGTVVPFDWTITNAGGESYRYLEGTITVEGRP